MFSFPYSFCFQDKKEKELDGAGKRRKTSQSEDVSIAVRVSESKINGRYLLPTSVPSCFFFFFNPGRVYIGFFRLNLILFQMLHIHAIFSTNIVLTFMKEYYTANVAVV